MSGETLWKRSRFTEGGRADKEEEEEVHYKIKPGNPFEYTLGLYRKETFRKA